MDQIDGAVLCPTCETVATRRYTVPGLVMVGPGFTRQPAIMSDPIAAGHPGRHLNWGMEHPADYPQEAAIDAMGNPAPPPIVEDASDLTKEA